MPTLSRTISLWYHHTIIIVISMLYILMPYQSYAQIVIFESDFETTTGDNNWIMQGGAADGNWVIGQPSPYVTINIQMEIAAFDGNQVLLTGNINNQDVDGGPTSARSPGIVIPSGSTDIDLAYYFSYYINSSVDDYLLIELRDQLTDNTLETLVSIQGSSDGLDAAWVTTNRDLSAYSGLSLYIYVESCLLYTSPSPRDRTRSRMPSSA